MRSLRFCRRLPIPVRVPRLAAPALAICWLAALAAGPARAQAGSAPAFLPDSSAASPIAAGTLAAHELCLLDRLRTAPAGTTVGELRNACRDPIVQGEGPARELQMPGMEGPAADPAETPDPAPIGIFAADTALAGSSVTTGPQSPPVERRIVSESRLWGERFALLPHRPNYLLPLAHAGSAPVSAGGDIQRNEVKFQVSFKLPLTPPLFDGRVGVFFAYTGQAWWQAYNDERSSPFREYSHEPEFFASWRPPADPILGWTPRLASAGFVHQSNGRSGPLSRSWNRLFAELVFDRPDGWWLALRPWWRIPEDAKPAPDSPFGDDNPGIQRHVGDGEMRLGYSAGEHRWTLTGRRGLRSGGKGSIQLDWSRPTGFSPQLRWYLQYFDGYGESLIDYRTRLQRIGFGVMLNDWY